MNFGYKKITEKTIEASFEVCKTLRCYFLEKLEFKQLTDVDTSTFDLRQSAA